MGAVFALFAGFYYWTPKIVGKTINDFYGKIHFWTLFVGVKEIVQICIYLISFLISYLPLRDIFILLSKPISINEIIDRELKDTEDNDIDNDTLNNKLNSLPTPKSPNPNKGKNKLIFSRIPFNPEEDWSFQTSPYDFKTVCHNQICFLHVAGGYTCLYHHE